MPTFEQVFTEFRGMNRRTDRLNSPTDFVYDCLNGFTLKDFKGSNLGVTFQREGSEKFNDVQLDADYGATKKIKVLFEAKWDGGGTDIIVRAGTAWGKFDGVDTFDSIITGRADDVVGQALMYKNELIMLDGGVPQKATAAYSVSALSSDSNMPQDATSGWVHRNKLWLNSPSTPMMAYFSKTNNANGATAWTGATDAGTLDLSTVLPEGDTILGYRTYGGRDSGLIAIICRKYTVIYSAGANVYDFTFVQYFPTTCISIKAADYVGKDIVYPSTNNLTSLFSSANNDELDVKSLSHFIEPYYRQLISTVSNTDLLSGAFDKRMNFYYLNLPITNNFQTLVYSVDAGNFVGRFTYPFNIYSMLARINGDILVGDEDGYVRKINTGSNDDGTAISFKLAMPALYFKKPQNYKKPHTIEALIQATKTLTLNIDYWYGLDSLSSDKITKSLIVEASSSLWDEALWDVAYWDTQGNEIVHTSDILGRGRMMFIEFRQNTLDARIIIPWFLVRGIMEGVN